MKEYKVPFSYVMYGDITVKAESEDEAMVKAEQLIECMPEDKLRQYASLREDSQLIDEAEFYIRCTEDEFASREDAYEQSTVWPAL